MDWRQWISLIEVPALAGLAWVVLRVSDRVSRTREDLAGHRTHVAEHYASNGQLAAVEARILRAIEKLERKVDLLHGIGDD